MYNAGVFWLSQMSAGPAAVPGRRVADARALPRRALAAAAAGLVLAILLRPATAADLKPEIIAARKLCTGDGRFCINSWTHRDIQQNTLRFDLTSPCHSHVRNLPTSRVAVPICELHNCSSDLFKSSEFVNTPTSVQGESRFKKWRKMHVGHQFVMGWNESMAYLRMLVRQRLPFSVARYGDGELKILSNQSHSAQNEWSWSPRHSNAERFRQLLAEPFQHAQSSHEQLMMIGLPIPFCSEGSGTWEMGGGGRLDLMHKFMHLPSDLGIRSVPLNRMLHSWQFGNLNYNATIDLIQTLLEEKWPIMVVCNRGRVKDHLAPAWVSRVLTVSSDCLDFVQTNFDLVTARFRDLARAVNGSAFLFSSGPVSNVAIAIMHTANPRNTYLDIGGSLDYVLSAVRTRDFHPLNGDQGHFVRAGGALVNGQNCTETRWMRKEKEFFSLRRPGHLTGCDSADAENNISDEVKGGREGADVCGVCVASSGNEIGDVVPDSRWLRNESCARQDMTDFYREAIANVHRFDSYGWNAWAWDEKPQTLGMTAFVLCHVRERCAAAELMIRAAGFDNIQFADTTRDGSEINAPAMAALVSAGELSPHFISGSKVMSLEQRRKYVAQALDHRDFLRAALSTCDKHRWIAIFEDDIILTTRPSLASSRIQQALLQLPQHADTLHLEYCNDECSEALYNKECDSVASAYEPSCSAGILYSRQGLKKLLDSLSRIVAPHAEHIADSCRQKRLNCFKIRQPVFAQDVFWDNIFAEMVPESFKRHGLRLNGTNIIIMNTRAHTQRTYKYRLR